MRSCAWLRYLIVLQVLWELCGGTIPERHPDVPPQRNSSLISNYISFLHRLNCPEFLQCQKLHKWQKKACRMQEQISSMPVSSSGRREGKQTRSLSLPGVTRQSVGEIKLTLCSTVIHVANHTFSSRTFIMVNFFCYVFPSIASTLESVIWTGLSNKRDLWSTHVWKPIWMQ